MAIGTFNELKTAVASWADRTDLTSVIPDFITLAEATINNGDAAMDLDPLRVREMEAAATVTVTAGSGALPAGWVGMKRVALDGDADKVVEYATPEWYVDAYPTGDGGYPKFYTIVGANIIVSADVAMTYYTKVPALSDAATTNWLLTKAPNAYLFGALFYLEIFAKNEPGAVAMRGLFRNALSGLAKSDTMNRGGSFARRASSVAW